MLLLLVGWLGNNKKSKTLIKNTLCEYLLARATATKVELKYTYEFTLVYV